MRAPEYMHKHACTCMHKHASECINEHAHELKHDHTCFNCISMLQYASACMLCWHARIWSICQLNMNECMCFWKLCMYNMHIHSCRFCMLKPDMLVCACMSCVCVCKHACSCIAFIHSCACTQLHAHACITCLLMQACAYETCIIISVFTCMLLHAFTSILIYAFAIILVHQFTCLHALIVSANACMHVMHSYESLTWMLTCRFMIMDDN